MGLRSVVIFVSQREQEKHQAEGAEHIRQQELPPSQCRRRDKIQSRPEIEWYSTVRFCTRRTRRSGDTRARARQPARPSRQLQRIEMNSDRDHRRQERRSKLCQHVHRASPEGEILTLVFAVLVYEGYHRVHVGTADAAGNISANHGAETIAEGLEEEGAPVVVSRDGEGKSNEDLARETNEGGYENLVFMSGKIVLACVHRVAV